MVNSYRSSIDFIEANKAASASKERLLLIELAQNRINGDDAEHKTPKMRRKVSTLKNIDDILFDQLLGVSTSEVSMSAYDDTKKIYAQMKRRVKVKK